MLIFVCVLWAGADTRVTKDFGPDAQLLLSAVNLQNGRTGLAKTIDVLRGSTNQSVAKWMTTLPCYGAGKHKAVKFWQGLAGLLLTEDLLETFATSFNGFGFIAYRLSAKGTAWLSQVSSLPSGQVASLPLVVTGRMEEEAKEEKKKDEFLQKLESKVRLDAMFSECSLNVH